MHSERKDRPVMARTLLGAATLGACILTLSCFEPPVSEEVEVRFFAPRGVLFTSTVEIRGPAESSNDSKANPLVLERVEEVRRELATGQDSWSRRIESIGAPGERIVLDRDKGRITRSVHRAFFEGPEDLRPLLAGAVASVAYSEGEHWAEFALHPLSGSRATEAQRRSTVAALDGWSEKVAVYLRRVSALYAYLDEHPDRAAVCFTLVFKEKPPEGAPEPTEDEQELADSVNEAEDPLLEMFAIPRDSAWSPDELFRLVYGPFPGRLRVRVPAAILESEGFAPDGERRVAIPEIGLYGAIRSLEGRWVSPDPLVATVESDRKGSNGPFDVAEFARKDRSFAAAPSAAEVKSAIETWVMAAPVYRVRWTRTEPNDLIDSLTGWDDPALRE